MKIKTIKGKGIIVITLIIFAITTIIPLIPGYTLMDESEKVLKFIPTNSKEITIGWRHSVEKAPWNETYQLSDNKKLRFKETIYKAYGAGTPDTNNNVEFLNNGFIRVTGIERIIPFYSLYYVSISEYYIELNKKKYPLSQFVPEHSNVRIQYKKLPFYKWLLYKIS